MSVFLMGKSTLLSSKFGGAILHHEGVALQYYSLAQCHLTQKHLFRKEGLFAHLSDLSKL